MVRILSAVYWILVAVLPFVPAILSQRLLDRMGCAVFSECFTVGATFMGEQGISIAILGVVLWPLVGYKLWILISKRGNTERRIQREKV